MMAKRARRLQCFVEKTVVSLHIHELIIPRRSFSSKDWDEECDLSICFEKGGKLAVSEPIHVVRQEVFAACLGSPPAEMLNIPLPSAGIVLELPITIYRDKKTGQIQEKLCHLILRKSVKTLPILNRRSSANSHIATESRYGVNVESFVGISKCSLKLHDILSAMTYNTTSFDATEMRISFDLSTGVVMALTLQVLLTSSTGNQGSDLGDMKGGDMSLIEENMSMISDLTDISALGAVFSNRLQVTKDEETSKQSKDRIKDEDPAANRSIYLPDSQLKSGDQMGKTGQSSNDFYSRGINNNDNSVLQQLLLEKDEHIQMLEEEIRQCHQQHETERGKFRLEIQDLQMKIQHEEYARQLLSDLTRKTDKELARSLAQLREECSQYQILYEKASVEAQILQEEVNHYQESSNRLQQEKQEERNATRQATEAVAQTMMRNANLQEENEQLISELVEVKLQFANMMMEREIEQKKLFTLRKALQVYAEQAALLELKLLNAQNRLPQRLQGAPMTHQESCNNTEEVNDPINIHQI